MPLLCGGKQFFCAPKRGKSLSSAQSHRSGVYVTTSQDNYTYELLIRKILIFAGSAV